MIAAYVQAALEAPLAERPSHLVAEVRHIAARDQVSLFGAALEQWRRERDHEEELPL